MIGLTRGSVQLVAYSPTWADEFEQEKVRLQEIFGKDVPIEHIGSTSIPGLAAKPLIDIQVGLTHRSDAQKYIDDLMKLGYNYMPERDRDYELFMPKGPEELRTHYLHIMDVGGVRWNDVLIFRDYLRTHPDKRAEYQLLKRRLAQRFLDDRENYTAEKSDFISTCLAEAKK